MWTELVIIVALVVLNGLFAGAEIAVVALRSTRVEELAGQNAAGRHLAALRRDPERFLATVQIGITTISATAAAFGGATLARHLGEVLAAAGLSAQHAHEIALAAVITCVSYLSLVLGELVPKSLGLKWSERYALLCARPLHLLGRISAPLVWVLTASSNAVLRLFGDETTFVESQISREELLAVLEKAGDAGQVSTHATEIAARAIGLDHLHAGAVMVPRTAVVGIREDATHAEIADLLEHTDEDRFPVLRGHDDVIGYVTTRDLGRLLSRRVEGGLRAVTRPVHAVPESAIALELLADLQRRRVPIAVVVDESGAFDGIVDVDDLAEEIVGSLVLADRVVGEVERAPDGSVIVPASLRVHVANHALGCELPVSPHWSTVGGLVVARLGAIPKVGAATTVEGGVTLEVVETSARRVLRVRVRRPAPEPATGQPDPG
jgi:putative hemolysin